MTAITYDGTIAIASGNNLWSGATDETNHRVVVIADESPTKVQVWDMVTRTQVGADITTGLTSGGRTLVVVENGASAIIMGSGASTAQCVQLTNGYITTSATSGTTISTTRKGQHSAVDLGNRTALFVGSGSSRTVTKVVYTSGGTLTVSSINVGFLANTEATSIIYKSSDRFIVGTEQGGIYEIDSSGNIYNTISIGLNYDPYHTSGASLVASHVYALAYDNGLLMAVTAEGVFYKIDYNTQTVLYKAQLKSGSNLSLSPGYNGTCLLGINATVSTTLDQVVRLCDFTCSNNCKPLDLFYGKDHGEIIDMGIDTSNGKAWILQDEAAGSGVDLIHILSLSPRASTTRDFSIQDNGSHQKCRLILIDDTDTDKKIITDTLMQSPATYRVPTGKTVKEVIKAGDGVTAKWGYGEYST